jgi:hypothetical protein
VDVEAVFTGLRDSAGAIIGLNVFEFVPDSITPPVFFPAEVEIDWDQTFGRGMDAYTVTARLLVAQSDDRAGQKALKGYLAGSGASSLKAALQADKTLGGACDALHVRSVRGYGRYEHAGQHFYGAEFSIYVIGPGS